MRYLRALLIAVLSFPSASQTTGPRKLYVVDRGDTSAHELNWAALTMAQIMKRCPGVVTVTMDRATADFVLTVQMKASTLANAKADVVYISPAIRVQNTAKDVCKYMTEHAH